MNSTKFSFIALKLDMSKAYDGIEWSYVRDVMVKLDFLSLWVRKIMNCISSVSFLLLINVDQCLNILPKRGLRQGCPQSPYIFIICIEDLSALLCSAQVSCVISYLKVARASWIYLIYSLWTKVFLSLRQLVKMPRRLRGFLCHMRKPPIKSLICKSQP